MENEVKLEVPIMVTMPIEEYNRLLAVEKVSGELSQNNAHLLFFVERLELEGFTAANMSLVSRGYRITRQVNRYKIEKITK